MKCPTCGYSMDAFDKACPRCTNGIVQLAAIDCLVCQHSNSTKLYACSSCDARLPTEIATLPKFPLKEYQKKATTLGNDGRAPKAVMVLKEAAEFYPDDLPTRQVLIGILERTGRHGEVIQYQNEIMNIEMKGSELECLRHGDAAHLTGNARRAVGIFHRAVQYHPHSAVLHERLAHAYHDIGEMDKSQFELQIVSRLVARQQQLNFQQQQRADNRSHTNETAGTVAGVAIGTTGAVVGGGITVISLILGIGLILFGVAVSFFGVLLCITILGLLPGVLLLGLGVSIVMAGVGTMAGGAAVGATGGMLGLFAGALTSGTALLHRSSRKNRNKDLNSHSGNAGSGNQNRG